MAVDLIFGSPPPNQITISEPTNPEDVAVPEKVESVPTEGLGETPTEQITSAPQEPVTEAEKPSEPQAIDTKTFGTLTPDKLEQIIKDNQAAKTRAEQAKARAEMETEQWRKLTMDMAQQKQQFATAPVQEPEEIPDPTIDPKGYANFIQRQYQQERARERLLDMGSRFKERHNNWQELMPQIERMWVQHPGLTYDPNPYESALRMYQSYEEEEGKKQADVDYQQSISQIKNNAMQQAAYKTAQALQKPTAPSKQPTEFTLEQIDKMSATEFREELKKRGLFIDN